MIVNIKQILETQLLAKVSHESLSTSIKRLLLFKKMFFYRHVQIYWRIQRGDKLIS